MKAKIKDALFCFGANAIVVIAYFFLWLFLHYLWMEHGISLSDITFLTLPIVLLFVNFKLIDDEAKIGKYLKIFFASTLSFALFVWIVLFLGVAFHHQLGGKI